MFSIVDMYGAMDMAWFAEVLHELSKILEVHIVVLKQERFSIIASTTPTLVHTNIVWQTEYG